MLGFRSVGHNYKWVESVLIDRDRREGDGRDRREGDGRDDRQMVDGA